ncbi:MAG: Unknown protein [uncultured Thiotrichaceae bacterium]|uniref:Uncharacterized protein n=1 Tax=uncultured Thiotrichaceae bacterium TaxID=298394 RepID=A0A6S6TZD4_9GAMM|nr:MAG: Unknown protein [uncultured Thiotrichaceae bacterium]
MSEKIVVSLEGLRKIQSGLYEFSQAEIRSKSAEDQKAHADNLHRIGVMMMTLEKNNVAAGNEKFKHKEDDLVQAVDEMENTVENMNDFSDVVRSISSGLNTVDTIIRLL